MDFTAFVICSLHALLCFGRQLMFFLYNYNRNFAQRPSTTENEKIRMQNNINSFLLDCGIAKYTIQELPDKGKWNLNGTFNSTIKRRF